MMLAYVFLNYREATKINRRVIYLWIGILCLGLLSNIIFQYQGIVPVLIDTFITSSRFLVAYFFASIYIGKHPQHYSLYIYKAAKIVAWILALLVIHDSFFSPFFARNEFRYFTYSLQLMFPHPTYLAYAGATLLIYFGYSKQKKGKTLYMILSTIICFSTLRSKALGFLMLYWMVYVSVFLFKRKKVWFTVLGSVIAAFFVGYDQIITTFFTSGRFSPRSILMKDSIDLMINHFPLGTGFGTFATVAARDYYSPLYTNLGYQAYRGMNSIDTMFLSDSFWPSIIAQFGIMGIILFVVLVISLFKRGIKVFSQNNTAGFSMIMILVYMLVTSLAESAFFNPGAFLMFLLYGMFERENELLCQCLGQK
jgi:hypothetical protein